MGWHIYCSQPKTLLFVDSAAPECLHASFLNHKNIEPLHDEYATLWKELETKDCTHLGISLDVKIDTHWLNIFLTLQEPGYNHFKVTIITYHPENRDLIYSGIVGIEEARVVNDTDGYLAFVEANYLVTTSAKNHNIANNWYKVLVFTETLLVRCARICKLSHLIESL